MMNTNFPHIERNNKISTISCILSVSIFAGFIASKLGHIAIIIILLVPLLLFIYVFYKKCFWLYFLFAPLFWAFSNTLTFPSMSIRVNTPVIICGAYSLLYGIWIFLKSGIKDNEKIRIISLIYIISIIPGLFLSRSLSTGLGIFLRVISPYLILFSTYHLLTTENEIYKLIRYMKYSIVTIIIILLLGYLRGDLFKEFGGYTHLRGTAIPFQTFASHIAALFIIFCIDYVLIEGGKNKVTSILGIIILLPIVYFSYYRTAWGLISLCIILFFIFFPQKKIFQGLFILGLLLILVETKEIISLILRYVPTISSYDNLNSVLSGRLAINNLYLEAYFRSPLQNILFGIGYIDTSVLQTQEYGTSYFIHNDFLFNLIQTGPISFLLYILFFIFVIHISIKQISSANSQLQVNLAKATLIIIILVMVAGMFAGYITSVLSSWYFYSIIGAFLALAKINQRKYENNYPEHN